MSNDCEQFLQDLPCRTPASHAPQAADPYTNSGHGHRNAFALLLAQSWKFGYASFMYSISIPNWVPQSPTWLRPHISPILGILRVDKRSVKEGALKTANPHQGRVIRQLRQESLVIYKKALPPQITLGTARFHSGIRPCPVFLTM